MKVTRIGALLAILCLCAPVWADTVILKDGTSYSGKYTTAGSSIVNFTDRQGIKYQFPERDVQSLVFTSSGDTVTLRDGRVYSGQFTSATTLDFTDNGGIRYQFPLKDTASLVFSLPAPKMPRIRGRAEVIPAGTEITITSNEAIDSATASIGQTYSAEISENLRDSAGAIALPAGTPAMLMIRNVSSGGFLHSPDLVLDLASVSVKGKKYNVVSSTVKESNGKGIGANKRTAEWLGGGAAVGSLVGAIFGGGKGAAIGAASGAGAGGITQIATRGNHVQVPAEAKMTFRLESTLILQPAS